VNPSLFPLPLFRVGGDSHNIGFQRRNILSLSPAQTFFLCRSGRHLHQYASAVGDIPPERPWDGWRLGDFVNEIRWHDYNWYELYGGRVVRACLRDVDGQHRMYLYDFNRYRASRRRPPTPKPGVSEAPTPETTMAGDITNDILPVCASRVVEWSGFELMCDDEHIILREDDSYSGETELIILTM